MNDDGTDLIFYRRLFATSLSALISAVATILLAALIFFIFFRETLNEDAEFFLYIVCVIVFLVGTGLLNFTVLKPNPSPEINEDTAAELELYRQITSFSLSLFISAIGTFVLALFLFLVIYRVIGRSLTYNESAVFYTFLALAGIAGTVLLYIFPLKPKPVN